MKPIASKQTKTLSESAHQLFELMNFTLDGWQPTIKKYQSKIDVEIYQLIRADQLGATYDLFFYGMNNIYSIKKDFSTKEGIDSLKQFYRIKLLNNTLDLPSEILARSFKYPSMLLSRIRLENDLFFHESVYILLKRKFEGKLKERLLANYLIDNTKLSNFDSLARDALTILETQDYSNQLRTTLRNQTLGTPLYNFNLPDSNGKMISLSDFRGKVVFIDFWFTGCGGCADYFKSHVSKLEEIFKGNPDIAFITISIDGNKSKWLSGLRSGKYTSPQAINLYTGESGLGHPVIRQLSIDSYPHPIIIASNGTILVNDTERLRLTSAENLITLLQNIIIDSKLDFMNTPSRF